MTKKGDDDPARILLLQGEITQAELLKARQINAKASFALAQSKQIALKVGARPLPKSQRTKDIRSAAPPLRSWTEIVADARIAVPEDVEVEDIISGSDAMIVADRMRQWSDEFTDLHRLRTFDCAIAGLAGTLAGIADVVLVQVPRHAGFLGGASASGGPLSNAIKDRLLKLLPPETVRRLEQMYQVSFDAASSQRLTEPVAGFGPRTHRLQTPGHDPLLAWIFGVRDVLMGECTTIGSDGKLIIQKVAGYTDQDWGVDLFANLLNAFKAVAGHLLSDVSTPAGLSAPLFGFLQLIQTGNIKGRTVAEISRLMYRSGYDFRHFLAGGVGTALIEVIIRTAWLVRELQSGTELRNAVPLNQPRLNSTLFLAHSIAAGINAGKVAVSQDVLSVNYAQWFAFAKYGAQQTAWLAVGRESQRRLHVRRHLDNEWALVDADLGELWARVFV